MLNSFEVGVKGVIINNENKFLMLIRSDTHRTMAGQYDLPGGKISLGETFIEGFIRETIEETGILLKKEDVYPINTWGNENGEKWVVGVTFLAKIDQKVNVELSYEHSSYKWLSLEEGLFIDIPDRFKLTLKRAFKLIDKVI